MMRALKIGVFVLLLCAGTALAALAVLPGPRAALDARLEAARLHDLAEADLGRMAQARAAMAAAATQGRHPDTLEAARDVAAAFSRLLLLHHRLGELPAFTAAGTCRLPLPGRGCMPPDVLRTRKTDEMAAAIDAVGAPAPTETARGRAGWDLYERRIMAAERLEALMLPPWDGERGPAAARRAWQAAADQHLLALVERLDAENARMRALRQGMLGSAQARQEISEGLSPEALLRMSPEESARLQRLLQDAGLGTFDDFLRGTSLVRRWDAIRTRVLPHHLAASMRQAVHALSEERLQAIVRARQNRTVSVQQHRERMVRIVQTIERMRDERYRIAGQTAQTPDLDAALDDALARIEALEPLWRREMEAALRASDPQRGAPVRR